jgi:hypothetical protein
MQQAGRRTALPETVPLEMRTPFGIWSADGRHLCHMQPGAGGAGAIQPAGGAGGGVLLGGGAAAEPGRAAAAVPAGDAALAVGNQRQGSRQRPAAGGVACAAA